MGEEEQAFTHLRLALAVEAEAGQVGLADVVAMFQGRPHCRRGEIALAQAALARMQSHDNYLYSVVYPIIQLELALGAGQPAQAAPLAQQIITVATASGDRLERRLRGPWLGTGTGNWRSSRVDRRGSPLRRQCPGV